MGQKHFLSKLLTTFLLIPDYKCHYGEATTSFQLSCQSNYSSYFHNKCKTNFFIAERQQQTESIDHTRVDNQMHNHDFTPTARLTWALLGHRMRFDRVVIWQYHMFNSLLYMDHLSYFISSTTHELSHAPLEGDYYLFSWPELPISSPIEPNMGLVRKEETTSTTLGQLSLKMS